MRKMFGSTANAGGVIGRVKQQTMQYAGKAEKTVDTDYESLSNLFKELCARAEGNEKILRVHLNAIVGILQSLQGVADVVEDLFPLDAKDGHDIFAQAILAVNGETREEAEEGFEPVRSDSVRTRFESAYEEKIWGPLKAYRLDMDMLSKKRQQRNSMRLDYDAAFATASKYAQKPPRDTSKKMKADALVEQTGVMYNMVNQEVMSRMQFYIDGRVKFWCAILHAVMECEAMSGLATNKEVVPAIKQLAAWIENGVPAPAAPAPAPPAMPPSLGLSADAVPLGAPPIGFGAPASPMAATEGTVSNFGAPLGGVGDGGGGDMFVGMDEFPADLGSNPFSTPMATAVQPAPAPAPSSDDPWDQMFSAGASGFGGGGDGGGSAI